MNRDTEGSGMIHDVYYTVSPKSELMSSLGGVRDEISRVLSSSNLWTGQLSDRGGLTPVDTENLVKALFLLNISDMPEVAAHIKELTGGGFHISTDIFDRFWEINRIHEDGNIKEAIRNYGDDPRFQDFIRSSAGNIQCFVNRVFSKA